METDSNCLWSSAISFARSILKKKKAIIPLFCIIGMTNAMCIEEYKRHRKITDQELICFVQSVAADGHDRDELVQSVAQKGEK